MEKDRTVEILVAMMFLVLVFIMVLIGLNLENIGKSVSNSNNQIYVDNSKTYNYNYDVNYGGKDYDKEYPKKEYDKSKDYETDGYHKKEYFMGTYADTYKIYVFNDGASDYFRVRLYVEDYEEEVREIEMRKYVPHGEKILFYYREINREKYEHTSWEYKVLKN
ncbi:hypothetical protein HOD29_05250 [archaeon]|jgi:hypothetical protein|nr:hypothetical protein [archaeon]